MAGTAIDAVVWPRRSSWAWVWAGHQPSSGAQPVCNHSVPGLWMRSTAVLTKLSIRRLSQRERLGAARVRATAVGVRRGVSTHHM